MDKQHFSDLFCDDFIVYYSRSVNQYSRFIQLYILCVKTNIYDMNCTIRYTTQLDI